MRRVAAQAYISILVTLCGSLAAPKADAQENLFGELQWGEPQSALVAHFGRRAFVLQRPIDFGDSYTQVVLRNVVIGGVTMIAFFQIDKATGGLKRIQLERQRHGVNPPAFRGLVKALDAQYGAPDAACSTSPGPRNGYQTAAELDWSRNGNLIRMVLRDTTIQAVEGCLGDLSAGPCGLTGQLFVRMSPLGMDIASCQPSPH